MADTDTTRSARLPESGELDELGGKSGRGRLLQTVDTIFWPLLSIVACILIWQLVVVIGHMQSVVLPSPVAVIERTWSLSRTIWDNTLTTLKAIMIGYAIAVIVGVLLAVAIAFSRTVEKLVYPLLVLTQAIPKVAVAPLFLVWFGFGLEMTSLMAFVLCLFPIVINTALGLKALNQKYIRLGMVMGGNPLRLFVRMRLPAAALSMFAGFKLAITFATIGAVVGELVAGTQGLGYLANEGAGNLDTTLTFSAVLVLSILGIVLFYIVHALEYFIVWWERGTVRQ